MRRRFGPLLLIGLLVASMALFLGWATDEGRYAAEAEALIGATAEEMIEAFGEPDRTYTPLEFDEGRRQAVESEHAPRTVPEALGQVAEYRPDEDTLMLIFFDGRTISATFVGRS